MYFFCHPCGSSHYILAAQMAPQKEVEEAALQVNVIIKTFDPSCKLTMALGQCKL